MAHYYAPDCTIIYELVLLYRLTCDEQKLLHTRTIILYRHILILNALIVRIYSNGTEGTENNTGYF